MTLAKLKLPKILNTRWLERQQTTILSAALVITTANILSSLSGLVRERALISAFFNTYQSQLELEAFQLAFQVPDALFQLIVLGALSAAFIPIFIRLKKKNNDDAFCMTSVVMNWLLIAFGLVSLVIFIWARPITLWRTGSGFTSDQVDVVVTATRIMLFAQILFAISNFFSGILQSYRRFIIPAIAPILYNLGIIIGALTLKNTFGIQAASLGVVIGALLHMLIQLPFVVKLGFRWKPLFNLNVNGVKELFKLMPPRVMSYTLNEFQKLILGFLTTSIGGLSFFSIRLAMKLMVIPIRLFGVPIGQASLSFLAHESDRKNRFRQTLVQSIHQVSFLAVPAAVLLLILRVPIVRLVFGTKNLPWSTTLLISKAVIFLALSVAAQAVVQLVIRAFHALEDTLTPFIVTTITVVIWAGLSALGVLHFHQGTVFLAAMISLTAFLELGLFLVFLEKKVKKIITPIFFWHELKIAATGFLMAVFLYLPFRILDELIFDTSKTIELIALTVVTATIGGLVYVYFSALFNIPELTLLTKVVNLFKRKKRKALPPPPEIVVETTSDETLS